MRRGKGISRAVMIEHTLFSLPFAISAFLIESKGRPEGWTVFWILTAVFGARNGANALNRLIDRNIDARNPRTANRDLPSGRVKSWELWFFTAFCGLLFLTAAWQLNPLCLILVIPGVLLIAGYSFTKRFTWLCHFWLGITCSAAVMGSFLALSGRFELRYFPLTMAVALWIAGFDIIYALQDLDYDQKNKIHSVPARFGRRGALYISGLSHSGTIFFLMINLLFFDLRFWTILGIFFTAMILLSEQVIAWKGNLKLIPLASYQLNQILSPLFMIFILLDIYLPGGMFHI
jgi:4-hydroxybenzoate polyprenyltransferase